MIFTINDATFSTLGVVGAQLTYRVGRHDMLVLQCTSASSASLGGSTLGSSIILKADSTIIMRGTVTSSGYSATANNILYKYEIAGVLYLADFTTLNYTKNRYAIPASMSSAFSRFSSDVIPLDVVRVADTPIAGEIVENLSAGDYFRKLLGYIGDYYTRVNPSSNKISIYDLSLGSVKSIALTDVLSFDISQVNNSVFVDSVNIGAYADRHEYESGGVNMSSPATAKVTITENDWTQYTDDAGASSGGNRVRIFKKAGGPVKVYRFTQSVGPTLGSSFTNNLVISEQQQYDRINTWLVTTGNPSLSSRGINGRFQITQLQHIVRSYYGNAAGFDIRGGYLAGYGIPYTEVLRDDRCGRYAVADISFKALPLNSGEFTPVLISFTAPICQDFNPTSRVFYEGDIGPVYGQAAAMYQSLRSTKYTGTIVSRIPSNHTWNDFDRITYNGITYSGIKEQQYDLVNEIMTLSFSGTVDRTPSDGTRVLRTVTGARGFQT